MFDQNQEILNLIFAVAIGLGSPSFPGQALHSTCWCAWALELPWVRRTSRPPGSRCCPTGPPSGRTGPGRGTDVQRHGFGCIPERFGLLSHILK